MVCTGDTESRARACVAVVVRAGVPGVPVQCLAFQAAVGVPAHCPAFHSWAAIRLFVNRMSLRMRLILFLAFAMHFFPHSFLRWDAALWRASSQEDFRQLSRAEPDLQRLIVLSW